MLLFRRIFMALTALLSLSAGAEILTNPGFESGTSGWAGRSCLIAAESTQVHSGSGAVRVYGRSASWDSMRQNILSDVLSNGSGTEYTFSAWVKMETVGSHTAKIRLRTNSENKDFTVSVNDSGWTKVSGTATLSWSTAPTEAWLEIANNTVDASYYVDDCSLTAGNAPPTFNSDPVNKSSASVDVAYSGSLADDATDPNGDPITFGIVGDGGWLNLSTNGVLSGTPAEVDKGTNIWTVSATDNISGTNTATLVIVVAGDEPPEFDSTSIIETAGVANSAYSGSLADDASDPNGDAMSFAIVGNAGWLSLASDGMLSGTPSFSDLGTNTWTVSVTDGTSGTNTASLTIVVLEGAVLPHFAPYETNGLWTTSRDLPGWSSNEADAGQIRPVTYSYAGALPLENIRHEQVMDLKGPVEILFSTVLSHTNILVDTMIQVSLRTDPSNPDVDGALQAAFYFNENGKLVVRHALYDATYTTVSSQWTTLSHTAVTNGQWIRLKISCDYLNDTLRGDNYYTVELDGTLLTSSAAYNTVSPSSDATDRNGSYFLCANSGNGSGGNTLAGISADGILRMDDLTVTTPLSCTADGTPHEWLERFYPGSNYMDVVNLDTDGDGLTALDEYLAGTDPTDISSSFRITGNLQSDERMQLIWPSSLEGPFDPYQVEVSTNLTGGTWIPLQSGIERDLSGINTWMEITITNRPAAFFRVVIP
jgi:hypothetical protein